MWIVTMKIYIKKRRITAELEFCPYESTVSVSSDLRNLLMKSMLCCFLPLSSQQSNPMLSLLIFIIRLCSFSPNYILLLVFPFCRLTISAVDVMKSWMQSSKCSDDAKKRNTKYWCTTLINQSWMKTGDFNEFSADFFQGKIRSLADSTDIKTECRS